MLEKNKDYIEMRVSSTDCAFVQNGPIQICIDGYVYATYMDVPDPGELYILISKEKFEKLQAENEELKKKLQVLDPFVDYKELIEKREALEGKVKVLETEAEVYSRALQEWKEGTGYPSPSAVKTALESGASWCHAYNEVKENNQKLADSIQKWKEMTKCETPEAAASWITLYESAFVSWKNVTGYSTPEDYMCARISGAFYTPFDYTAAWQKATGCDSPEKAQCKITDLYNRIDKMKEAASIVSNWADKIVEG